jgi:outer membrane protein OmpA-like peptidoglycan-associated protein
MKKLILVFSAVMLLFPAVLAAQSADTSTVDWSRYDYIPGQQVLFYDDFSGDKPGEAPQVWKISEGGKAQVKKSGDKFWLHAAEEAAVSPTQLKLSPQFTLEMDFNVAAEGYSGRYRIDFIGKDKEEWASITLEPFAVFFSMSAGLTSEKRVELKSGAHHFAAQVDGAGFKVYVDNWQVLDIPKAGSFAATQIEVFMPGPGDEASDDLCMITNFCVAQGPATLQKQLTDSGKIVAYGVYFEADKHEIRPESTPTLKQFAELLQADASLNFSIECHDNELPDGGDNVRLSQARAEALKDLLVESYRIPSDRLTIKGWGETRPLVEAGTVDGIKMNQRVEFIRK